MLRVAKSTSYPGQELLIQDMSDLYRTGVTYPGQE